MTGQNIDDYQCILMHEKCSNVGIDDVGSWLGQGNRGAGVVGARRTPSARMNAGSIGHRRCILIRRTIVGAL
jgi:hypothetical protein